MAQAGVPFSGPIEADAGKITRFTVEGDRRSSLTGWYVLHTDGVPAGEFGCWKRGIQSTWCSREFSEITQAERDAIERRRRETEAERKRLQDEAHAQAAQLAQVMWEAAQPCESHPYLTRKGVRSYGLRTGTWRREFGDREVVIEGALLVPVRDGKRIVSLQAIFQGRDNPLGRDKDFLPGGKKRGCYFPVGQPGEGDTSPTIYIAEGYATAASIHEATDCPVIVAFDAGNLRPVAERIRGKFPAARLVIAADNDRFTATPVENPGVYYATMAAREVGADLRVPAFASDEGRPTDFNDLHQLAGIGAVLEQLDGRPTERVERLAETPPALPVPANDNAPTDMAAVDWFSPFPDINGKGKPLATIENVAEACRRLGVTVRYNVIRKDLDILIPGASFTLDNRANAALAWIESACVRFGIPTGPLQNYLSYIGDQHPFNPVAEWITSRPWDKQSRLADLFGTIEVDGESGSASVRMLKEAMMRRWMLSAVAAAFRPDGVSAHGVLVLQGDQYLGKTAWFKRLVPADLGVIADGLSLRTDDKDSVKMVVSNWLVELGELDATFRKSDIAQLKAFLTRDRDVLRRPYAKLESEYARRTVFFASVNPRQFLHDPTGNRRYWTIPCVGIDHGHKIDMQQVWAEIYEAHFLAGESWYLAPEEMALLNEANKDHEVLDPIRERILTRLAWEDQPTYWRWMTATDVMAELGFDRPTRGDVTHCGMILQELNGKRRKVVRGKAMALVPQRLTV